MGQREIGLTTERHSRYYTLVFFTAVQHNRTHPVPYPSQKPIKRQQPCTCCQLTGWHAAHRTHMSGQNLDHHSTHYSSRNVRLLSIRASRAALSCTPPLCPSSPDCHAIPRQTTSMVANGGRMRGSQTVCCLSISAYVCCVPAIPKPYTCPPRLSLGSEAVASARTQSICCQPLASVQGQAERGRRRWTGARAPP